MLLKGRGVSKSFGGLKALKNIDFHIKEGEILGLVGPNGAGKTTLINVITGIYRPDSGVIIFKGEDITKLKPEQICKKGICRTFQIVQPFLDMTALENVMVGVFFGRSGATVTLKEARERAMAILDFVGFPRRYDTLARSLNTIELKRLGLAAALATDPELLLLDEVTTGLNPAESDEAIKLIKRIRENGVTILMVEHVMRVIMNISDRIIVLHHGEKIGEGTPKEVAHDERVIKAYLGERYIF